MRLALFVALVLGATAAPRQGCGNAEPAPAADPCAGNACVTSCEGQACGVRCQFPCPTAPGVTCGPSPTDAVCDGLGHCLSPTSGSPPPPECLQPPPSWGCVGKSCGDSCGVCPPGTDPAHCPVPTFAATACDMGLQCATVGTFSCSPESACRGKACGAPCDFTPGQASPYATACSYNGLCVPVTSWLCYEPCAGKACGERCQVCPAGATDCEEPRSVNACDRNGACVADNGRLCAP